MSSSFSGQDLFGSGPHRFSFEPSGSLVMQRTALGQGQSGQIALGPLDAALLVTGRLTATDDSDLLGQLDAINALLTSPPTVADLVDHHGNTFTSISFVRFEPQDRTDRGRQTTLGYTARFVRLT